MIDSVEKRMKLFVVGEHSPDPKEWKNPHVFVLAETADEAVEMAHEGFSVAEISMCEPAVLI
jgi:hypothetical protein